MKTIVICRHAKSDWPTNVSDVDRPLKARGVKNAHTNGQLLAQHGFMPDLIMSSPANRALSTAKIVAGEIGYTIGDIVQDKSLYFTGISELISLIEDLPDSADSVMIFGHNPVSSYAVRMFLNMHSGFDMPTAGMACLEISIANWKQFKPHYCELRWLHIPRMQRKK